MENGQPPYLGPSYWPLPALITPMSKRLTRQDTFFKGLRAAIQNWPFFFHFLDPQNRGVDRLP